MSVLSRLNLVRRYQHWRYKQLAGSASSVEYATDDLRAQGFYSQCGQDKFVTEHMFRGLRNGVFVDIGAHDGVAFSNTKYFEERLNWMGIAIEPLPDVVERLARNAFA